LVTAPDELDEATRAGIRAARSLPDRPHDERLVPHASVGALVAAQASAAPGAVYMTAMEPERSDMTYGALAARVRALAGWLATHHGIGRGDRVATLSVNHQHTVLFYFAAWWLGAVVVPVNIDEDDDRIAFILTNSGARLIVSHSEQMNRAFELSARCPGVRGVVPVSYAGNAKLANGAGGDDVVGPDDEALIVYTSGTTGPPKGVVLSQYNLLVDARAIASWHGFTNASRVMCVLPIHHVNGTVVTLLAPLVAGASVVLCRRFQTATFLALVREERVNVVSVVPTLLKYLLERSGSDPGYRRDDHGTLAYVICGAGPLTVELARRFEEKLAIRILHGYGLSETTCYSCFLPVDLPPGEHASWMREHGFPSIGTPLPVNEMSIFGPDDRPLPPGERGEIVVRGHNVMQQYFQRPDANQEAFRSGWFHSGDEGFWQPDSGGRPFFFITGRIKELIIRGGVKVAPLELDEVLARIPGVLRAMAVGFDSSWYGEEVGAYVDPDPAHRPPLTPDAVLEHCRRILPFHKCPKVVVFGSDFPVTSTGKYQRNRLKPLFAAYREVQFRDPARGQGCIDQK
jgi:long-chain acyl-CoA synthetase